MSRKESIITYKSQQQIYTHRTFSRNNNFNYYVSYCRRGKESNSARYVSGSYVMLVTYLTYLIGSRIGT